MLASDLIVFICFPSWVGYEHSSFCGQQFVLEKGDYPRFEAYSGSNSYRIERMISFRPICCAVGLIHCSTRTVLQLRLSFSSVVLNRFSPPCHRTTRSPA